MIHYNIWFSLAQGASAANVMARVSAFLRDQERRGQIASFTLLKNRATAPTTKLHPYGALIVFTDADQFGRAFQEIARLGVHSGQHGAMATQVSAFQAETFEVVVLDVGL